MVGCSAQGGHDEYAIKFFAQQSTYELEAALYAQPAIAAAMPPLLHASSNADGALQIPNGFDWPPYLVTERGLPLILVRNHIDMCFCTLVACVCSLAVQNLAAV